MGSLGTLPLGASSGVATRACRRCGCTDDEACVVDLVTGPAGETVELGCSWVEPDLCSRCTRPGELTRAQRHEVARIADRWGPTTVTVAVSTGLVQVRLDRHRTKLVFKNQWGRDEVIDGRAPTVTLDQAGRAIRVADPLIQRANPLAKRRGGRG